MKRHEIKRMPLSALRPADYNPRRISDEALGGLTSSVKRFGLVEPIVWNRKTKTVIGGHQRLRALTELGEKEVDVVVVNLPRREEKALNVVLNSPAIAGTFTDDLEALLSEIEQDCPELFDELLLDELRTEGDED